MTDPYQTLDLDPSSSWEEVKSAYRELVQFYHPDKHTNHSSSVQKRAIKKFSEINQAYENIKLIYEKEQRLKKEKEETKQTNRKYKEKSERDSSQQKDRANFQETLKKAERGNADAQYNLGVMYAKGDGVPQDNQKAVKWFRLSVDQGNADAQFNLGVMYDKGQGVSQDLKEAVRWYRLAAEQVRAKAQYNLGVMYVKGDGVPQDYVLAYMWFHIAGSNGHKNAVTNRNILKKEMSPSQIEKAQEMGRNWKPKK